MREMFSGSMITVAVAGAAVGLTDVADPADYIDITSLRDVFGLSDCIRFIHNSSIS